MDTVLLVVLLVAAGLASGFLNTLASGGSVITMPILIFLGVPATVANGTNRLPIVAGSLTAVSSFYRSGILALSESIRLAVPSMAGAAVGALIASNLSPETMAVVVFGVTFLSLAVLFLNPKKLLVSVPDKEVAITGRGMVVFFLIGIWAGFIIIDTATFLLLALVLLVGFELIAANAVKNFLLLGISSVSLAIFLIRGEVNIAYGLIVCVGSIAGSWLASLIAHHESVKVWIFRLLIVMVILELVHFVATYGI